MVSEIDHGSEGRRVQTNDQQDGGQPVQTATTTGILAKIETITGLETETNAGTGPRTEPEIGTALLVS